MPPPHWMKYPVGVGAAEEVVVVADVDVDVDVVLLVVAKNTACAEVARRREVARGNLERVSELPGIGSNYRCRQG